MGLRNFSLLVMAFGITFGLSRASLAQSPTYGLGKTPTEDEIRAWDIAISPDGKELPPGTGTAKEGAPLKGDPQNHDKQTKITQDHWRRSHLRQSSTERSYCRTLARRGHGNSPQAH